MRALVVYESMYGNTHLVADAIGRGLAGTTEVTVVPVHQATSALVGVADLLVVGGPTHVHGMSRDGTRHAAVEEAQKPDSDLHLDPDAEGEGLRQWFDELDDGTGLAASFDTRMDVSALLSGRASKGIGKRLRHHGRTLATEPTSFLVDKANELIAGEADRAEQWGRELGGVLVADAAARSDQR